MNIVFRNAKKEDREFIINANQEINLLSGLDDSTLEHNIDKDLFEDHICKAIIVENNRKTIGFLLYSYIYWANCGKGIYLSQAYVKNEYRKQGILKQLLLELETREKDCHFITDLVGTENIVMRNTMNQLNFKPSDLTVFYRKIK